MEAHSDLLGMLDLMIRPGFCVKDCQIVKVNQAAEGYFIFTGMDVTSLLATGREEYRAFSGGCLYLTLSLSGKTVGASVTRMQNMDVFLLEQEADSAELRSLALAARELRTPLSGIMATSGSLFSASLFREDPALREQAAHMNRGLFQLLRILGNMSDAQRYTAVSRQETVNIANAFSEIFRKAEALISRTGVRLVYTCEDEGLCCLADMEQLERAVLNMLSNAVKFTPAGGTVEASLTRRDRMLRLSVQDSGTGIAESIRANIFHRYLRQLTIEDSRYGIGLGMVLIRSAAAHHGGTVLIDHPAGKGTRITMTLEIRQTSNILRSPLTRIDYAGGYDHVLLEFAENLPAAAFEQEI